MERSNLYGRLVTWPKTEPLPVDCSVMPTFIGKRCQRCGQDNRAALPGNHWYCLACLKLGRVSTRDVLLFLPEPNDFPPVAPMTWRGQLTSRQATVSQDLVQSYQDHRDHLVWAVTGAGKTEMLFPVIDWALHHRGRVAILSPRVDVVLELAPRLQAAFSTPIQVLHGQERIPYHYRQLVLATTHQALRFRQAFDLIVVDEVDAFPFRGDEALAYAVSQAKKKEGMVVYLTATPTPDLLKRVKHGQLRQSYLPQRFHGGALPLIQVVRVGDWRKRCPRRLAEAVKHWQDTKTPFLIFVPEIKDLVLVEKYLQDFPTLKGATVYSQDPDRALKVVKLRRGDYQYLITTTILERGVTVPGLEVAILGADEGTFSTAALVQIAGRVGRSKDRQDGLVLALVQEQTLPLRRAQQQIAALNQKAQGH
ncbi:DEAD/DEAH box helicase [Fructobacillus ficulneus]|uniref:DEAD/DEAH box helicase n=1 Tax=Fructobacillus ficulneus TaxID=157463 RepID=UPI0038992CD0